MKVNEASPKFKYCTDNETGKCGVCGQVQERPVADDYYDRFQYFQCGTCPAPPKGQCRGSTYILCTNETRDRERGRMPECCCIATGEEEPGHCVEYKAHPIEITHLVPCEDMHNSDSDWEDNEEKIGYYFNTYKHPEELTETEIDYVVYDSAVRYLSILKSGLAKKYKLVEPQIGIECDLDGGYTGFVGKCLGCRKIRMGKIWGD